MRYNLLRKRSAVFGKNVENKIIFLSEIIYFLVENRNL